MKNSYKYIGFVFLFSLILFQGVACKNESKNGILVGADRVDAYLTLLQDKRVALVVNHTSVVGKTHLIDTLLTLKVDVKAIFSPEHGLRGQEDAGAEIEDGKDIKTGLPVYSLHGKTRKPLAEQLENIDVVVFDMQDVGVRFYTYISTMHYVMESCAENNKMMIILDRPNPLGFYVDGPVLKKEFKSFVGMHPIPVVHGLSVGELAHMINGEGWLKDGLRCEIKVISCENWDHSKKYKLPLKPSPNLPNQRSVLLYPSLCFFEATDVSVGRGTLFPFQVYGYPLDDFGPFKFTPKSIKGMSLNPKQQNIECFGEDLRMVQNPPKLTLSYLLQAKEKMPAGKPFITRKAWFNLLAGNDELQIQIESGMSEAQIKNTWQADLNTYKQMRKNYLLYPDFQ